MYDTADFLDLFKFWPFSSRFRLRGWSVANEASPRGAGSLPGTWTPEREEDRVAVHNQLKLILASTLFNTSKSYPALLQYVVEATRKSHSDPLKERSLGIEVFHRDPLYETSIDPVVRFAAGEVRKGLV